MSKDIRLVGLDLDGTVLNQRHEITQRTKEAIGQAIARGCLVIPATGRPLLGIPKEFLEIPGVDYAVTANGATVIDVKSKQVVLKYWLTCAQVKQAFESAKGLYRVFDVFVGGSGYSEQRNLKKVEEWAPKGMAGYMKQSRKAVKDIYAFIEQQEEFEKCTMFFTEESKRKEARRILEELDLFEVVSSAENNLELSAKSAHKGTALLGLAKMLNLQDEQVMACGDSENDREMLKSVGLGVAMGNASDSIKELADWVTDTNEQDGVAKALEKFVLC